MDGKVKFLIFAITASFISVSMSGTVLADVYQFTQASSYDITSDSATSGCPVPTSNSKSLIGNNRIFVAQNGQLDACEILVHRWNISSIPVWANITAVTVMYNISVTNLPRSCVWNDISSDPATATAQVLWPDVNNTQNGTTFVTSDSGCTQTGNGITTDLGASAVSDLQSKLSNGWWAVGMEYGDMSRSGSFRYTSFNFGATGIAYLQVNYTTPTFVVSIVNGSCANGLRCMFSINSTQNSHVGACGYYNISVCSNFTTSNIRSNICQLGNVESGVLSLFQVNNTHAGVFGVSPYTNQVCVSPIVGVNVRSSCLAGETCMISINSTSDSHVGDCSYYGNKICLGQADTSTPVITTQSPSNTTILNSWTWANATVSRQASVVSTSLDGAANVSMTNSSGNWNMNVSGLTNGAHKIIFYANDTFNDQASQTVFFTVDTTNLTITVQSPTNVTYSQNSVQAAMTLNRPGTTTALVSLDGAANISLTNTSGSWNTQITGMNNGPHSVTFYANDSAGRVATPVTVFFTVLVRAIAANPNPAWWNDTVIVNGTDAPFSSVSVLLSGATICSTSANSIGLWGGCNFTAPLGVGGYNLTAVVGSSPTYMTLKVKPSYGAVPSGTSPRSVLEIPLVVQEPSGGIRIVISRLIISHGAPS